jgi:hypothetical protein
MPGLTRRAAALLAAVAAALVAVTTLSSGGAAAAAGTGTAGTGTAGRSWPASVPVPPQPDCADQGGGTALKPSSAQLLPGGGYAYNYLIDGVVNQYLVPPASFSPLHASAAQLAEYGFPVRPAIAAQASAWGAAMASYTGVPLPQLCLTTLRAGFQVPAGMAPSSAASRVKDNSHWSGYVAHAKSNAWTSAEGQWTLTRLGNCRCKLPADVVTWTGVGGWSSGALLQAGTEVSQTRSRTTSSVFYEYLERCKLRSCGPAAITVCKVKAGDAIYTQESYQYSARKANFFIEADGKSFPIRPVKLGHSYYDGRSAEWITEQPGVLCAVACSYYPLAKFGTYTWKDAYAETTGGSYKQAASLPTYDVIMKQRKLTLAEPSDLRGAGFKETWKNP